MAQLQCPRCGSDRVEVLSGWQDPDTHRVVTCRDLNLYRALAIGAGAFLLALLLFCLGGCLVAAILAATGVARDLAQAGQFEPLRLAGTGLKLLVAGIGLLLLVPPTLLALRAATYRLRTASRWPPVTVCTCRDCGYRYTDRPEGSRRIGPR
jgi:hypothetical protein